MKRSSNMMAMDGFDGLAIGRLAWLGLALAAIGWALLLGATAVADLLPPGVVRSPTFHADLVEIAKCLIGSGFALAVMGALQTGFGTLNSFFGAVLTRSAQRASETRIEPVVEPVQHAPTAPETLEQRPYRKLADGSVEVDTIFGTRTFKTMAEAREFI